jgi:uncharacterized protein (TIGR03435 family)
MKTGVTLLFAAAAGAFAQSAATAPAFEVASVRVSASAGGRGHMNMFGSPIKIAPGSLTMRGISFRAAVAWANDVKEFQVNGPSWMDEARYDIVAKAAGAASPEELRPMLRALLAERCKLVSHRQTKEMNAWIVTVAKNGPKFKIAEGDAEGSIEPNLAKMEVAIKRTPISQLTDLLGRLLRAPVIDQTGLTGNYDITIGVQKYQPEKATEVDMLSMILTAIQEELGLKLDNRKMPVDLVVVDSAERAPVEN